MTEAFESMETSSETFAVNRIPLEKTDANPAGHGNKSLAYDGSGLH